ncbi:MAG: transglutaminase domain-containing protein [Clostridiales bacterium]|nr:transglutaminase domain-containing protein [Clostridiales bacterium]
MKTKLLLFIALLIVCLSFSSCAFVKYNKYPEPEDTTLSNTIEEYIELVDDYLEEREYFEDNLREISILIQDAKNELNECTSEAQIKTVYEKHLALFDAIDTAQEDATKQLNAYIDFDLYRENEQILLQTLLDEYKVSLSNKTSVTELDSLLRDFKTEVNAFKTDADYYKEEFNLLVDELKLDFWDIDFADYRTSERIILMELLNNYDEQIQALSVKEDAVSFHNQKLIERNNVKTFSEFSLENSLETYSSWEQYFDDFCQSFDGVDEAKISEKLLEAYNRPSYEINLECALLLIELSSAIGDDAIENLKYGVAVYIDNCIIPNNYREAEKNALESYLDVAKNSLLTVNSNSDAINILDGVKQEIASKKDNDTLWTEEDSEFLSTLSSTYGANTLELPTSLTEANDYYELASIIDFYSFYQVDYENFLRNTFRVKLNFPIKTAQYEINEVYWYSELLRSAVGITGYFEENSSNLVITLIPYKLATNSNTEEPVVVERYKNLVTLSSDSTLTPRSQDFEAFPYLTAYTKQLSGVWNTQQLWYALEHEYIPIVVANSPAERALLKAKSILREIIKEGMTDEEKIYSIYNWFASNITYDNDYTEYLYPENRELFPDELASTLNSFHVEGALFDNLAVCCAYAKTYLLLLRIEAIESYRITLHMYKNNAIGNNGNTGYGSHAIVAIKLSDGKFYYSDVEESYIHYDSKFINLHQLAVTPLLDTSYASGYTRLFPNLNYGDSVPSFAKDNLTYKNYSVYIKSNEQLFDILEEFDKETKTNIQLSLFDYGLAEFDLETVLHSYPKYHFISYKYNGLNEYILYK